MDWSDLRIFLAIAREGTLGAAARKLGQTQPTMGRRLRALESSVGHILFQRTVDGFVLTGEGRSVLSHAERMEEEALALQRRLAGQDAKLEGTLRLAASDWFGTHMLAPVLVEFTWRHPKICIDLVTNSRVLNLRRLEADIAFRAKPFEDPEVISRRLLQIPYGLYGPAGAKPPKPGDGAGARIIAMSGSLAEMPDAIWIKRVLPQSEIVFRTNNRAVHAQLCAKGAGLAILPRMLGDATSDIVRLDIGESPPSRDSYVGYHRDLRGLARLRALLDTVIDRLATRRPS